MNTLDRIQIWAGRLPQPLWRTVEAAFVAFLLLCLFMMFRPAHAQDVSALNHASTSEALVKTAEAQIETAKVLQILAQRMTGGAPGAAPAGGPAQQASPECKGFFACAGAFVGGVFDTGIRAASAAGPIVNAVYGHRTAVKMYDMQAAVSHDQTTQVGYREETTRAGFATASAIAANGSAALATVAAIPAPPATQVTVTGNGPVNTGNGTITNGSNNPVNTNPAPVVVGTTGTTVNRGP